MNIDRAGAFQHMISSAEPRLLKGSPRCGILLIHGWTGYPGQLYYLGEYLNKAGYSVMIVRLPGHGTTLKDFVQTGARDWLRRSTDAYLDFSLRVEQVVAAGISMGGLLALHLGACYTPAAVVAAAPAVALSNRNAYLTPFLKYFIKEIPLQSDTESSSPDEEYIRREYWSSRRLASVAELIRLQRMVRKELAKIEAPLLLLEAGRDELVPHRAGTIVKSGVSSKHIHTEFFSQSTHQIFNGEQREEAAEATRAWLSGLGLPL